MTIHPKSRAMSLCRIVWNSHFNRQMNGFEVWNRSRQGQGHTKVKGLKRLDLMVAQASLVMLSVLRSTSIERKAGM